MQGMPKMAISSMIACVSIIVCLPVPEYESGGRFGFSKTALADAVRLLQADVLCGFLRAGKAHDKSALSGVHIHGLCVWLFLVIVSVEPAGVGTAILPCVLGARGVKFLAAPFAILFSESLI
jgi:hypothetical protein